MSTEQTQDTTPNPAMTPEAYATAVGATFPIGGRLLKRLAEFEFAAYDDEKKLDYHFFVLEQMKDEGDFQHQVEIDIYDSHITFRNRAYVDSAFAVNLAEAVVVAFGYFDTYDHPDGCDTSITFDGDRGAEDRPGAPASPHADDRVVELLREAAERLAAEPRSDESVVYFPNWDGSDDPEERIRDAAAAVLEGGAAEDPRVSLILEGARAVLAKHDPNGDGGSYTSKQALAALIRYVADTLYFEE